MNDKKSPDRLYLIWAHDCQRYSTRKNLLGVAASHMTLKHDQLDVDPFLLNVLNGTIDLKTGQLRPHRPEDFITKIAPVHYDPEARCDLFLQFLNQIFKADDELIAFVQRAIGYALTGSVREQVFFLLYGTGANGKSTFMELLVAGLGDYAIAAPPGLLLKKKHEGHPTDLADLFGARFVTTSEVKTDARWDEERIKSLTGGDTIKARRMREDFWSFSPTHKIFISTNHKPATNDSSIGFWRRVRMIPFTTTIPEDQRDPKLLDKLKAELPGILAWAVRGCLEWQRLELGTAAAVEKATADYRAESDQVAEFLQDSCELGPSYKVQAKALYTVYYDWCNGRKEAPNSVKAFGTRMRELGYATIKSSTTFYQGLRLANRADDSYFP